MTGSVWIAIGYLLAGALVASLHLGILWRAAQGLPQARWPPAFVVVTGFAVRVAGVAVLLLLVTRGAPGPLVLAMLGFVAGRTLVLRVVTHREASWT